MRDIWAGGRAQEASCATRRVRSDARILRVAREYEVPGGQRDQPERIYGCIMHTNITLVRDVGHQEGGEGAEC